MAENKTEIITAIASGAAKAWASYKSQVVRRNETPFESLLGDLFGRQMSDTDAALELVKDISRVRETMSTVKTTRKFNQIVKTEFK